MTVEQFMAVLEGLAPATLAEEWDNVGLLVGRGDQSVSKVLVALDLRDHVLDEAERLGCDLVLTHHPVIFLALSAVTDATVTGRLVLRAASAGIAIVAAHTNLDSAASGLNDAMAHMLGLTELAPLRPSVVDPGLGLGRFGRLDGVTLGELVRRCATVFDYPAVTFVGDPALALERDAQAAGADVYITGDLKYHDADVAEGLALISIPHGVVEGTALQAWTAVLAAALPGVGVVWHGAGTDPWRLAGSTA
jgi:dinuclear metal center YbgI/SA1388 family protein